VARLKSCPNTKHDSLRPLKGGVFAQIWFYPQISCYMPLESQREFLPHATTWKGRPALPRKTTPRDLYQATVIAKPLKDVFHGKLHDPGIIGLSDLTKGPAIERSKRIVRISGGGDQRPHTVGDVECFPTSFQALVLSDPAARISPSRCLPVYERARELGKIRRTAVREPNHSLKSRKLCSGFLQDEEIGISVLPQGKKLLILVARLARVAG
jgi:hypothetical protein